MKKLLSILLCCIVLSTTFLVPVAHAEVATATLVSGAVVVTALTACGIIVGSHIAGTGVSASEAVSQAWAETTTELKQSISNTVRIVRNGATLASFWTANTWKQFTNWARSRFPSSGATMDIEITPVATWNSSVITYTGQMPIPSTPRYFQYKSSNIYSDLDIPLTSRSSIGFRRDTFNNVMSAYLAIVASATGATMFRGIRDYTILGSAFYPVTMFKPLYNVTDFTVPYAYKWNGYATWTDYADRVANNRWYVSDTLESSLASGELVMHDGKLTVSKDGIYTPVIGQWTSIGSYIKACIESGTVIGIPLNDGTVAEPDTDTGEKEAVTVPVGIDTSYYPREGVLAPPVDIGADSTISIPLPIDNVESLPLDDGESVTLKDVEDLPLDLPYILEKSPAETMPRVDIGNPSIAIPDTDSGAIDIPNDADNTIPDNPATPSESDDTDTNKLKLPKILLQKFPFCIPWDFYNAIKMLRADPVPPRFDFSIPIPIVNYTWQGSIDFSQFDDLASIVRWFLCAIWIVSLILLTKSIIK